MPYANSADKAAWAARYHAEHREAVTAAKRRWQERNRHKRAAHIAVGNALRDGRLVREPCEVCGDSRVEAHHDDYTKPLDVRWLCPDCHKAHHNQARRI